MNGFILSPYAAKDIEKIVRYIAQDNVAAALAFEDDLIESFRQLAKFPNSGRVRRDLTGKNDVLLWPVGKYLVVYRIHSKKVEIVRVFHGAQDIPAILAPHEKKR